VTVSFLHNPDIISGALFELEARLRLCWSSENDITLNVQGNVQCIQSTSNAKFCNVILPMIVTRGPSPAKMPTGQDKNAAPSKMNRRPLTHLTPFL
jgi:hypothetical protein